jgi:hypothetical protein
VFGSHRLLYEGGPQCCELHIEIVNHFAMGFGIDIFNLTLLLLSLCSLLLEEQIDVIKRDNSTIVEGRLER